MTSLMGTRGSSRDSTLRGESLMLINKHDPKHLRGQLAIDHPGEFGWEFLQRGAERWEVRITRLPQRRRLEF